MKKQIRSVAIMVVMTLMIATFMFTCFATGDVPAVTDPPVDTPTSAPDTPTDSPIVDPTIDPSTEQPSVDPSGEQPTVDPSTEPTVEPTVDNNHYDDFNNYGDNDNDGIPDNSDNIAPEVSANANQYKPSTNSSELKETQWSTITLDKSNKKNPAKSFAAIKQNTSDEDNGQWMLYLGITLIALAIIGILYFIIATVTYHNKLKPAPAHSGRAAYNYEKDVTVISANRTDAPAPKPVSKPVSTPAQTQVRRPSAPMSEEFLTAADYNKKIRSGASSSPKHYEPKH